MSVNLGPSGVVIYAVDFGPYPYPISVPAAGGPLALAAAPALLDSTGNWVQNQPLAGGLSLPVSLSNISPGVGTVPTGATITGGSDYAPVSFTPKQAGTTTISVAPSGGGYPIPLQYSSIQLIVY
jgi:hypothetical protein